MMIREERKDIAVKDTQADIKMEIRKIDKEKGIIAEKKAIEKEIDIKRIDIKRTDKMKTKEEALRNIKMIVMIHKK